MNYSKRSDGAVDRSVFTKSNEEKLLVQMHKNNIKVNGNKPLDRNDLFGRQQNVLSSLNSSLKDHIEGN